MKCNPAWFLLLPASLIASVVVPFVYQIFIDWLFVDHAIEFFASVFVVIVALEIADWRSKRW